MSTPHWIRALREEIDISSLVYFRIVFGLLMLYEVVQLWSRGWIESTFFEVGMRFSFPGFSWVTLWPGDGIYIHMAVLALCALFITIGFLYRLSTVVFFLGFSYLFLLEKTRYLNHFYFIALVAFLLILIPAHRSFSVDARLRKNLRSDTAPAWALWSLRAQIAVVYFFGGIAKLNADWLNAEPLRTWLLRRAQLPTGGPLLEQEWFAYFLAYGGLLFDLLIVPALLWRPTRAFAFVGVLFFHLMNAQMFNIGIFPWFSIAATALFFSPDFPRRVMTRVNDWMGVETKPKKKTREPDPPAIRPRTETLILSLLAVYFTVQVLLPLRHFLYPGNVSWTEEGHNFAWHMKLRDKRAMARFLILDQDTGDSWEVDPADYVPHWQYRKMITRPELIRQFCHHLADDARANGIPNPAVKAAIVASLNGHEPQFLVDPNADLGSMPYTLGPSPWILPLGEKLIPDQEPLEGNPEPES